MPIPKTTINLEEIRPQVAIQIFPFTKLGQRLGRILPRELESIFEGLLDITGQNGH